MVGGCGEDHRIYPSHVEDRTPLDSLSPDELVTMEMPIGYRFTDRVLEPVMAPSSSGKLSSMPRTYQRWHRAPGPTLQELRAVGVNDGQPSGPPASEAFVEVVQAVYRVDQRLALADFAARAEVIPGAAVAFLPLRPDGMDADAADAQRREPAVVIATDRARVFLALRGGAVHSVVRLYDLQRLEVLGGTTLAAESERAGAALDAGKPEAVDRERWATYAAQPHAEAIAAEWTTLRSRLDEIDERAAAERERQRLADEAHDAPLRAAADTRLEALRTDLAAAAPDDFLPRWCDGFDAITAAVAGARLPVQAVAAARGLLAAHAAGHPAAPVTATDHLWASIRGPLAGAPTASLRAARDQAQALDTATDYGTAIAAGQALIGLEVIAKPEAWRKLFAKPAEREAKAREDDGRPLSAAWLRAVAVHLGADARFRSSRDPRLLPEWVRTTADALDAITAAAKPETGGVPWDGSVVAMLRWSSALPRGTPDDDFRSDFADRQCEEMAKALRYRGLELQEAGWPASASALRLLDLALKGHHGSSPEPLHGARDHSLDQDGLYSIQGLLARVATELLPEPDFATAHGRRLVELLAEHPRLDWPLVRLGGLVVDPESAVRDAANRTALDSGLIGDAVTAAEDAAVASGTVLRPPTGHLHVVESDGGLVLALRDVPQVAPPGTAWTKYRRDLGLSNETREALRVLGAESAAIDAEAKEVAVDKVNLAAKGLRIKQLQREGAELEPRVKRGEQAAIDELDRVIEEHERHATVYKRDREALLARAQALDERSEAYHRRSGPLKERLIRERAVAEGAIDSQLARALDVWIAERLRLREARLRAAHPPSPELEHEIACGRWLVGAVPVRGLENVRPPAYARLRCEAIKRKLRSTPEYAIRVEVAIEWWRWSAIAKVDQAEREAWMQRQLADAARESSPDLVRGRIAAADLPAAEAASMRMWVAAAVGE